MRKLNSQLAHNINHFYCFWLKCGNKKKNVWKKKIFSTHFDKIFYNSPLSCKYMDKKNRKTTEIFALSIVFT